jgi:chromosome segregation ATPase
MANEEKDWNAEASKVTKTIQDFVEEMANSLMEERKLRETAEARIDELVKELDTNKSKQDRLQRTITELKATAEEGFQLKEERDALKSELDGIKTQLEKMSKTYKELVAEKEATIPVQELLALYIALLEDVFYAQPHAKTLFLLHGQKKQMTREEITKTAGHEATAIRKALGDLSRAELIDYDVETGNAELKKRLYPT